MLLTMAKIFSTKYFFIWINLPVVFAALDVTTIYREVNANDNNTSDHKIIAECHARTNALGFPFLIPSTGETTKTTKKQIDINILRSVFCLFINLFIEMNTSADLLFTLSRLRQNSCLIGQLLGTP